MGAEAIAAILTGIGSNVINAATLAANVKSQKEANEYAKLLALVQMMREDTAVQRRVADLKAAGLSPTLAAGSAAQATPLQKINAVQHNFDTSQLADMGKDIANIIQQGRKINAEIERTDAQTRAINQNIAFDKTKVPEEIQKLKSSRRFLDTQAKKASIDAETSLLDLDTQKHTGFKPTQSSEVGRTGFDVVKGSKAALDALGELNKVGSEAINQGLKNVYEGASNLINNGE